MTAIRTINNSDMKLVARYLAVLLLVSGCRRGGSEVLVGSCPKVTDDFTELIGFDHAFSIGAVLPDGVSPLGEIGSVIGDGAGNIYALADSRLFAFDKVGDYLWHLPKGNGPAEISSPRGVALVGGQLVVSNEGGRRLDRITTSGKYLASTTIDELGDVRLSVGGSLFDSLVVATSSAGVGYKTNVHVISGSTFRIKNSFLIDQGKDIEPPLSVAFSPAVSTIDNEIVVRHALRYELGIYSQSGDTLKIAHRAAPGYARIGIVNSGGSVGARVFSEISAPVSLPNGYKLVYGYWPTNVDDPDAFLARMFAGDTTTVMTHRTLDLFDASWCLRGSLSPTIAAGINLVDVVESFSGLGLIVAKTEEDDAYLHAFTMRLLAE